MPSCDPVAQVPRDPGSLRGRRMNQDAVPDVETRLVSPVISSLDKVQMINCRLLRMSGAGARNSVAY